MSAVSCAMSPRMLRRSPQVVRSAIPLQSSVVTVRFGGRWLELRGIRPSLTFPRCTFCLQGSLARQLVELSPKRLAFDGFFGDFSDENSISGLMVCDGQYVYNAYSERHPLAKLLVKIQMESNSWGFSATVTNLCLQERDVYLRR